ncbi:alpha/beta hydrolase [Kitasatospora aureofaciens]|uniref:alpha/beta hydrolase n=1 Tax=Kitasatospora aureofaciens TaxID=1894 RepID=UPI0036F492AD
MSTVHADGTALGGHLGDHPANADPRQVRGPPAERLGEGRRVGGEVAQGVGGRPLPDHDRATTSRLFARARPDWTDREAVAEFAATSAEVLGDDPAAARTTAADIWDRTPGTAPAVHLANQLGTVFSRLDCTPRWRERLPGIDVPTRVVHGRRDPFFPVGNGRAIAREIPGARLLVLDAATRIPDAAIAEVTEAMLTLGQGPYRLVINLPDLPSLGGGSGRNYPWPTISPALRPATSVGKASAASQEGFF